jgi:hypothetical protein
VHRAARLPSPDLRRRSLPPSAARSPRRRPFSSPWNPPCASCRLGATLTANGAPQRHIRITPPLSVAPPSQSRRHRPAAATWGACVRPEPPDRDPTARVPFDPGPRRPPRLVAPECHPGRRILIRRIRSVRPGQTRHPPVKTRLDRAVLQENPRAPLNLQPNPSTL